jgi:hypothetical protein
MLTTEFVVNVNNEKMYREGEHFAGVMAQFLKVVK